MMGCTSARSAGLAAIAGTLDEGRRLALESHLASCDGCARAQARLRLFGVLRSEEPAKLSSQAHARILAELDAAEPVRAERRISRAPVWAIAAGLAFGAVAAWLGLSQSKGQVRHIADDAPIARTDGGSGLHVRSFGSAHVEPAPGAVVAWTEGAETLRLTSGSVRVSMPDGGRTIRVATDRFVVVSLASVFVATTTSVEVEVGWVRIEDLSGREIARVAAGGEWRVSAPEPAGTARAACETCPALLRDAEASLARGRIAEARDLCAELLASRPSGAQAVEARLLLADADRIQGNRSGAVQRYLQIARTSRGSAGENALYAAAQLEAEAGHRAASETHLREYLSRYPRGRFARAAADRLGTR